jgi:hypothetical protein
MPVRARAADAESPPVAFDVLGGRYAVNDGGLPGEVCYWGRAPWPGPASATGQSQFYWALLTAGALGAVADSWWR